MTSPTPTIDVTDLEPGTVTVATIARGVADTIRGAYPDDIWVAGFVADKRPGVGRGGWVRFSLTERHPTGNVSAKMSAVITPQLVERIRRACVAARIKIADGVPVRVLVRVVHTVAYGNVQLEVRDIDAAFTVGRLHVDRDAVIAALDKRGVLAAQQQRTMPALPLRVALITSSQSAAYADFTRHLETSGYAFEVVCFDTAVQGSGAVEGVSAALQRTCTHFARWRPDVVVVVRGGGARTDLATFDDPAIAEAVAACPVAVVTGIGHEIDQHIADLAAHTSCKTPTAVAQHLIEHVSETVERTERVSRRARDAAQRTLERADTRLSALADRCRPAAVGTCERAATRITELHEQLHRGADALCERSERHLDEAARIVAMADPTRLMQRGWSIVRVDGRAVTSVTELGAGQPATVTVGDGSVHMTSHGTVDDDD